MPKPSEELRPELHHLLQLDDDALGQAALNSVRSLARVKISGLDKACLIVPAESDGDCGFHATRLALNFQGLSRLAVHFERTAFVELVSELYATPDLAIGARSLIEAIFNADGASDLIGWQARFISCRCWMQEAHFKFLSYRLNIRFDFYCLDPDHGCFVQEPINGTIYEGQESSKSLTISLVHISTAPHDSSVPLNHFDAIIIDPTIEQRAQFTALNAQNNSLFKESLKDRNAFGMDLLSRFSGMNIESAAEVAAKIHEESIFEELVTGNEYFHQIFENIASLPRFANKSAISFKEEKWSYAKLNQRANQLAHYLLSQGVKPNDVLIIALPHSLEAFVAILGIMKSGAAFSILSLPLEIGKDIKGLDRFRYCSSLLIFPGSDVYVISTSAIIARFACDELKSATLLDLSSSELNATLQKYSKENPRIEEIGLTLHDLAYITFTSGSTGNPKGAMIKHEGLKSRLKAHQELMSISIEDKIAQFCRLEVDAALMEMMLALGTGAELVLIPEDLQSNYDQLTKYYEDHKISIAIFTPTVWQKLNPKQLPSLRCLLTTGEGFVGSTLSPWALEGRAEASARLLINGYGPSEVTIGTSLCVYDVERGEVTIGHAISGVDMHVVNHKTQQPVMPGQEGEIYIHGLGVGVGYYCPSWMKEDDKHQLMQLNSERFLKRVDSLAHLTGPWYCTRDRGYCNERGQFVITGRYDRQFKIGGRIISPENIEKKLKQITGISENESVYVYLRQVGSKKHIVVGVVVSEPITPNTVTRLSTELLKAVDTQMLPQRWYVTNETSLATDWKSRFGSFVADLKSECLSFAQCTSLLRTDLLKPVEKQLWELWRKILLTDEELGLEKFQFGLDDHFHLLGGDSLAYMDLHTEFKKLYPEIDFPVEGFKRNPSIRYLARHVLNSQLPIKPHVFKVLSPEKNTLFFIHPVTGNVDYYTNFAARFPNYNAYGFACRGLEDPESIGSIEEIAEDYLNSLTKIQAEGPYFLIGHSAGGVIAYEMAIQLKERGENAYVFLLDTLAPFYIQNLDLRKSVELVNELSDKLVANLDITLTIPPLNVSLCEGKTHLELLNERLNLLTLVGGNTPAAQRKIQTALQLTKAIYAYHPSRLGSAYLYVAARESWSATGLLGWSEEQIDTVKSLDCDHSGIVVQDSVIDLIKKDISALRKITAWNLPHPNRYFTARNDLLITIANALVRPEAGSVAQAIYGLGGVGKTELAIEYANQARQRNGIGGIALDYDGIFWLQGQQLSMDFRELAKGLGIDTKAYKEDLELLVVLYKKLAKKYEKYLIILDDVDSYHSIKLYLPSSYYPQCHIIITSRSKHWELAPVQSHAMEDFSRSDSIAFISKLLPNESYESKDALAELFHDFPLALAQAVAYIKSRELCTILKFINRYRENDEQQQKILATEAPELHGHLKEDARKRAIYNTWYLSLERIKSNAGSSHARCTDLAEKLLSHSIYLSGKAIPWSFIQKALACTEEELEDIAVLLTNHSLIQHSRTNTFRIHKILQEVMLLRLSVEQRAEIIIRLAKIFIEKSELDHVSIATTHKELLTQLDSIVEHANVMAKYSEIKKFLETLVDLLIYALRVHVEVATAPAFNRALQYAGRAVEICEKQLTDDSCRLILAKANLTIVYASLGGKANLSIAKKLTDEALVLSEKTLGEAHQLSLMLKFQSVSWGFASDKVNLKDVPAVLDQILVSARNRFYGGGWENLDQKTKAQLSRFFDIAANYNPAKHGNEIVRILEDSLADAKEKAGEYSHKLKFHYWALAQHSFLSGFKGVSKKENYLKTIMSLNAILEISVRTFGNDHLEVANYNFVLGMAKLFLNEQSEEMLQEVYHHFDIAKKIYNDRFGGKISFASTLNEFLKIFADYRISFSNSFPTLLDRLSLQYFYGFPSSPSRITCDLDEDKSELPASEFDDYLEKKCDLSIEAKTYVRSVCNATQQSTYSFTNGFSYGLLSQLSLISSGWRSCFFELSRFILNYQRGIDPRIYFAILLLSLVLRYFKLKVPKWQYVAAFYQLMVCRYREGSHFEAILYIFLSILTDFIGESMGRIAGVRLNRVMKQSLFGQASRSDSTLPHPATPPADNNPAQSPRPTSG